MFVPMPLLIVGGLVFLVLLFLAFRPRGRSDDLMAAPRMSTAQPRWSPAPASGPTATLPPEIKRQAQDLVRAEEIIKAVKLVRDATGLGLKEAKDIVDAMR